MIRNSPVGLSPNLVVAIDGSPVNYPSLNSLAIDLSENQHDLCSFTMSGVPSRSITDYIGKSIFAQIDTGATFVTTFYGTIERPVPTATTSGGLVNGSLFQDVEFSCLGTSRRMRGQTGGNWRNHTLEDVARAYCDSYGFSLDVPSDVLVFPNLLQTDESDWQFLVRYATMMGYSVTCHGTHVHIFDPFKAKGRLISLHRLYSPARSSAAPIPGQVLQFKGNMAQRAIDGRYMGSSVAVFNSDGSTYDLSTQDILGIDAAPTYVDGVSATADTYAQAQRKLMATYKETYDYTAHVSSLGAAGMLPGGMATVDGYGDEFDGLWYVRGVRQDVRSGMYTSTIDLARNRTDTLVDTSAPQFRTPPAPQSIGGVWTTTNRSVNVY